MRVSEVPRMPLTKPPLIHCFPINFTKVPLISGIVPRVSPKQANISIIVFTKTYTLKSVHVHLAQGLQHCVCVCLSNLALHALILKRQFFLIVLRSA